MTTIHDLRKSAAADQGLGQSMKLNNSLFNTSIDEGFLDENEQNAIIFRRLRRQFLENFSIKLQLPGKYKFHLSVLQVKIVNNRYI